MTVTKESVSAFPHRRKPPLKTQTFRTLFRILSRCNHQSLPRHLQSDNGGDAVEKEVFREQTESIGDDDGNRSECVGAIENLESFGLQDGGSSDTQLMIDEIENMMTVEEDENVVLNQKNLLDECVEFRELQELLMDDLVQNIEGDPESDNNCNSVTMSLDENNGGGADGVLSNQEKNFNPQPTDLKECSPVQQQQVIDEENFGQNAPGNVLTSLNKSVISEASTSTDSGDKSSKVRMTGVAVDHDAQQSTAVLSTSVCSSGALISRNYGIEDDEREEGEFSSDLEVEEKSAHTFSKDTLLLEKTVDGEKLTEEILDKIKIPLVEKDKVHTKEISATLFTMERFSNYNGGLPVEAKESGRNEMKHKRKVVVYEDPILAEEEDHHKEKKKCRASKKQKKVSGANEHKKSGGKVEQMKGSVARNGVTCPVLSSSDLAMSSDNKDQNAGINPETTSKDQQDVVPCIKKKRGPLSEERKAKKKQQKRKKRAEKNRELGVKRLKLRPVVKPKPVTYCRHFLNGRCHEGEKCKFSHDTTPLTKSKPCCHFARHACMKGDDCPFDHQLSKYPCTNYVSKGYCSRGESCMFSHKLLPEEDVPETSNISTPEAKSHCVLSKNPEKVVVKSKANLPAVMPMPKGVCFLSSGKSSIADSTCPKPSSSSFKKNDGYNVENHKEQSGSGSVQKLNEISKGITQTTPPKGINFLSFGKVPLASLTVSSTQSSLTGILQNNKIPKSSSSHEVSAGELGSNASVSYQSTLRNVADTSVQESTVPSDKQQNCQVNPKEPTTNPFGSGQSLDFLSHAFLKSTPVSSQKALMSTLAFAAKVESEMKQNGPRGSSESLTIVSAEASSK